MIKVWSIRYRSRVDSIGFRVGGQSLGSKVYRLGHSVLVEYSGN